MFRTFAGEHNTRTLIAGSERNAASHGDPPSSEMNVS